MCLRGGAADIARRRQPGKTGKAEVAAHPAGLGKKRTLKVHTSLAVKLLILALLAAVGWRLYALRVQVESARQERDAVAAQVEIQRQKNDALAADIAEGATPEKMQEIARRELGWVLPGEYVFPIGS